MNAKVSDKIEVVVNDAVEQHTVKADDWARFKKLGAEIAALQRSRDAIKASFGLPDAKVLQQECKVVLVNGNGDEVGKATYSHVAEKVVAAYWQCRIS